MIYQEDNTNIVISDAGIKPAGKNKFEGKVFNSNNFKIYILKHGNDYLYVGKTNRTIGARFRDGFRSYKKKLDEEKKVYTYKWIQEYINKDEDLELFVFDLGTSINNYTEAIEAEIVFEIRKKYNKWPTYQNEIHFFNDSEDFKNAKDVAKEIFNKTKIKYSNINT